MSFWENKILVKFSNLRYLIFNPFSASHVDFCGVYDANIIDPDHTAPRGKLFGKFYNFSVYTMEHSNDN